MILHARTFQNRWKFHQFLAKRYKSYSCVTGIAVCNEPCGVIPGNALISYYSRAVDTIRKAGMDQQKVAVVLPVFQRPEGVEGILFFGPKRKLFNFLESSSSWHKRLGDLSQVVASWSIESLGPSWDGAENIELCSRCMCRRRSLHCQMGQDNSRKTSQHCLRCSLLSLWLVANFEPQHDFLSNLLQDGNTDISIQISQVFLSRNTRSKVSKTNFMGKPLLNSSEQSRSGGWIVALVEL